MAGHGDEVGRRRQVADQPVDGGSRFAGSQGVDVVKADDHRAVHSTKVGDQRVDEEPGIRDTGRESVRDGQLTCGQRLPAGLREARPEAYRVVVRFIHGEPDRSRLTLAP